MQERIRPKSKTCRQANERIDIRRSRRDHATRCVDGAIGNQDMIGARAGAETLRSFRHASFSPSSILCKGNFLYLD